MGHSTATSDASGLGGGLLVPRANHIRVGHRSLFASQLATDLDIETPPVRAKTTEFTWTLFSNLALLRFASRACSLKYAAEAFRDFYLLKVQKEGHAAIRLDDRMITIGPGDVVLCDGAAAHQYEFDDDNEHLCLIFSKQMLEARMRRSSPPIGDMINYRIAAHRSSAILMRSYAIGLLQQLERFQTEADDPLAARVLGDTILTCYSAEFETDRRRDDSWTSVQRFVESNLEDPALRPSYICEKLRLSAKSLQRVFRSQGTSCHKYIADARLDEASRRLSDPSLSARITDIAYDVGFDDLSYFSRSFRRKFGVSAREYRHSALRGTLPLWRGRPSS